jgi:hypothetical protein
VILVALRVWLDDRPGSLAEVAGRIGSAGGDVVGIDVLERAAGRAIDEFVVELADDATLGSIVSAIDALDGVDVELADVVPELPDPRLDALELAQSLVSASSEAEILETLAQESRRRFAAVWSAVLDKATQKQVAAAGDGPNASWLSAFVAGVSEGAGGGPFDVAWAALSGTGLVLVLGRDHVQFRERERRQINALTGIAAVRLTEQLSTRWSS